MAARPAVAHPVGMNQTILVAEDDPDCAALVETALGAAGYTVRRCQDGYQALAWAANLGPSLLILDYRLPGGDGLQVLSRLRLQEALRALPVILYSDAPEARGGAGPAAFVLEKSRGLRALLGLVARLCGAAGKEDVR